MGEANLISVICADAAASLPTKTFFQRVVASDIPIHEPVIPQVSITNHKSEKEFRGLNPSNQ